MHSYMCIYVTDSYSHTVNIYFYIICFVYVKPSTY